MLTRRVLSVDDDGETLRQRELLLQANGYSVTSTTSGQEALDFLASGAEIDLVVLDYAMPGMNGEELARRLREQFPHLPLLAVSAAEHLPESFRRLVSDTLRKGQDPRILLSKVAEVLAHPDGKEEADPAPPRTVLCVEDEELQLRARKLLFESAGYHVLEARSARGALDLFASSHVDVVVMDYWLSDQDGNGTAVAEKMKRMRPRTPIVMLSGFSALPGEGALVDSWLRKSQLEPEHLLGEVDRLIKLRKIQSQGDAPQ